MLDNSPVVAGIICQISAGSFGKADIWNYINSSHCTEISLAPLSSDVMTMCRETPQASKQAQWICSCRHISRAKHAAPASRRGRAWPIRGFGVAGLQPPNQIVMIAGRPNANLATGAGHETFPAQAPPNGRRLGPAASARRSRHGVPRATRAAGARTISRRLRGHGDAYRRPSAV